ncbi:hypothetical protein KUTeg_001887 [Tegillarca granosa]|uniref:Uncharacterized protein n=1 Tax=Tegillarca granosa TaxID=220873 RepID=A0ABQ9FST8_TEGGR|nr:hypothetical protein KUTeg_001887 [Tegillarca granosa]
MNAFLHNSSPPSLNLLRLLNHITWKTVAEHDHSSTVEGTNVQTPVKIPVVKPDTNKANPKIDNMPNTLWIWDIQRLTLCTVLIQGAAIKCIKWDPNRTRLALCTGTNKLYMWSPAGCLSVQVPVEGSFLVQSLKWSPEGNAILLLSKDQMCTCYLTDNASEKVD